MSSPRLHAEEVAIDDAQVRALIDRDHPRWASLPLRRVSSTGTESAIYRLGSGLGVRVPRVARAQRQVAKEARWLGWVAEQLPVEVPRPVAVGEPGFGYPYTWGVFRWVAGQDLLSVPDGQVDPVAIAVQLADVVAAVQRLPSAADLPANQPRAAAHPIGGTAVPGAESVPTDSATDDVDSLSIRRPKGGAPGAGKRGRTLHERDATVRADLAAVADELAVAALSRVWDAALAAPAHPDPPVWVHGDLLPGNVIVRAGRVVGLIDWASGGLGDPACESMVAWSLPPDAREAYRSRLAIDDAEWARGRGWVVEQAIAFIPYYRHTIPSGVAAARSRLAAVLADSPWRPATRPRSPAEAPPSVRTPLRRRPQPTRPAPRSSREGGGTPEARP